MPRWAMQLTMRRGGYGMCLADLDWLEPGLSHGRRRGLSLVAWSRPTRGEARGISMAAIQNYPRDARSTAVAGDPHRLYALRTAKTFRTR